LSVLNFFFTKLLWIDPCKKCINKLGGHAWQNYFLACSKLEAMAIYVVKSGTHCLYGFLDGKKTSRF
jgi:hypothetical protein